MAGYGYPNHPFLPNHQQPPLPHPQPSAPYGHNYTSNHSFSFPTSHPVPSVPLKNNNNSNSSSLFYKTRHCKKYRETGECPYGKSCIFAHGDEELRKPPGNSGLCHKFLKDGYCPYGNTCTYLHQHHHHHPAPPSSMTGDRQTDVAPTEVENMGDDGDLENGKRNVENMGGADHVENDQRNVTAEETRRILPNSAVRSDMDLYATPRNEENNNERNRDVERNKRFPRGKINTIYADWID